MREYVQLPTDLANELCPNVRVVPMPIGMPGAIDGWLEELLRRIKSQKHNACPACEHSPHPTDQRLDELRTMPYHQYLWTPEWRRTREAKLTAVDWCCRRCQRHPGRPHVHHLTYDHLGHEWLDELVVLCEPCHNTVHAERSNRWRRR